jgi:hypothetical protein
MVARVKKSSELISAKIKATEKPKHALFIVPGKAISLHKVLSIGDPDKNGKRQINLSAPLRSKKKITSDSDLKKWIRETVRLYAIIELSEITLEIIKNIYFTETDALAVPIKKVKAA